MSESTIRISSSKNSNLLPPPPENLFERLKTTIENGLPSNVTTTGYPGKYKNAWIILYVVYAVFLTFVTLYLNSLQYFWTGVAIKDRITNDYFNLEFFRICKRGYWHGSNSMCNANNSPIHFLHPNSWFMTIFILILSIFDKQFC